MSTLVLAMKYLIHINSKAWTNKYFPRFKDTIQIQYKSIIVRELELEKWNDEEKIRFDRSRLQPFTEMIR